MERKGALGGDAFREREELSSLRASRVALPKNDGWNTRLRLSSDP
jgi:hypothetical protein